jgi:hypothetical protein
VVWAAVGSTSEKMRSIDPECFDPSLDMRVGATSQFQPQRSHDAKNGVILSNRCFEKFPGVFHLITPPSCAISARRLLACVRIEKYTDRIAASTGLDGPRSRRSGLCLAAPKRRERGEKDGLVRLAAGANLVRQLEDDLVGQLQLGLQVLAFLDEIPTEVGFQRGVDPVQFLIENLTIIERL